MERINVVVSDEAKRNLQRYKEGGGFKSLDDALDDLLLKKDETNEDNS